MQCGCWSVFSVAQLNAQESNKGQLTGSLESNSIYYVEDTGLDAGSSVNPDDHLVQITI